MNAWFQKNGSLVLRVSGTILAIGLLVLLVQQNGTVNIRETLAAISPQTLGVAIVCIILSRLFISLRWHILLRSGGVQIPFHKTLTLVFMGLFSNNFLPTTIGGDVVRLAGAIQMGYDNALCLASIAADRVINMIGMSLAAPLGIWQLAVAGTFTQSLALGSLFAKGKDFITKTLRSFSLWFNKPWALAGALLFALIHMLFSFTANYALIIGMGGSISLWKVIGLSSLAYFVTLVPISINGYGVQELTVTYLLTTIGGISVPAAASTAVVHRLIMMAVSLPGAFTLPGVMGNLNRKDPDHS